MPEVSPGVLVAPTVGLPRALAPDAVDAVAAHPEELKASGFVQDELRRSGVDATGAF